MARDTHDDLQALLGAALDAADPVPPHVLAAAHAAIGWRTIDAELGINHTYLFAELNYADISGFGAKDKLVLSDLTYTLGLAFEF